MNGDPGGQVTAAPARDRLALWGAQVRAAVNGSRRSVEYLIGLVGLPTVLYAMFGLPNDATWAGGDSPYSTIAVGSFAAYGAVSLAIFTFVDELAKERDRGWIATMRATPIPLWSHILAKLAMACVYTLAIVGLLAAVSVPSGASELGPADWLAVAGLAVVGTVTVGTIGTVVAFGVQPRAATAIANLVFVPLAFCSGYFVPLAEAPGIVRAMAPWLPTYHFGRLIWSRTATTAEVDALTGIDGQPLWVHGAWVVALGAVGVVACRLVLRRSTARR
jgi:ABC-2 type transport system permease protein